MTTRLASAMCRCRSFLIGEAKKGHGKISWPNPIGKYIFSIATESEAKLPAAV